MGYRKHYTNCFIRIFLAPFTSLSMFKKHMLQLNISFLPISTIVPHLPHVLDVYSSVQTFTIHPSFNLLFDINLSLNVKCLKPIRFLLNFFALFIYFNKNNPKKSFDVYIDKNPNDTIPIKYKTVEDVKNTISKLERFFKNRKYPHKRIWQVGMIMYVRLKVLKDKKPKEYALSKKYFKFLKSRTEEKTFEERKKLKFSF